MCILPSTTTYGREPKDPSVPTTIVTTALQRVTAHMVAKTTGTGPCSPVEPRTSIEFYAIAASRRNKIMSELPRKRVSRISNLSSLTGVTLIVKSCGDVWRSQKRENRRRQTPLRAAMERPHWKTAIGGVARERRHMGGGGEEKEWEERESAWRVDGRER